MGVFVFSPGPKVRLFLAISLLALVLLVFPLSHVVLCFTNTYLIGFGYLLNFYFSIIFLHYLILFPFPSSNLLSWFAFALFEISIYRFLFD
jgi:hypothetical protein